MPGGRSSSTPGAWRNQLLRPDLAPGVPETFQGMIRERLEGLDGAVFAGRMINPTLCELQTESNLVNGVGQALFEQLVYDDGQLTNGSLADYTIPAFRDLPSRGHIGMEHIEDLAVGSVHGIGETLLPAVPPAIANAVFNACGARVRDLPISPEKVLRTLATSSSG